jgi:hypothetical protein
MQGSTVMTTASAICSNLRSAQRDTRQLRRIPREASLVSRIGTRQRAYATCHLAGCSTLKPRAGA